MLIGGGKQVYIKKGSVDHCRLTSTFVQKHLLDSKIKCRSQNVSRRKVDNESRGLREECTERYAYISPSFPSAKPVCLICNENVAVSK